MISTMHIGNKMGTRVFATAMLLPAIVLLLLLELYPFLTAVYTSFTNFHTVTRKQSFVGLQYYREILTEPLFLQSVWRSMLWTFSVLITTLVIGLAFSLVLHADLRGRNLARGLVLYPYLVPAIVAALSWRFMLAPATGIINYVLVDQLEILEYPINWLGDPSKAMPAVILVGIWKYIPFMVILFLARLQTTPLDLYDAARIDGANMWQEFRYITFPWLKPTIIIATLLRTNWLFNHFNMVYLMAFGGPLHATTTLPLLVYNMAMQQYNLGKAAAISMYMMLILIVLSVLYMRNYARAEEQLSY